ncbi:hypothetical protein VW35_11210 [Devosia soli]|uniref:DUF1206 domain-containing protein n=1 Tax=Devosia soli TaxID=361041 RepID=A0A0F5L9D5_9HYPH|nr:DUF1206 domain-containing protein [Devosia soli]KKB78222.1 hypothetical protein VW35_11210 [Devosia soli]
MPDQKFETLARFGYGARGVVYGLLGILTLASAFWGGGSEDTNSALSSLLGLPFGRIVLGLIAIGLLGYVLWKLAQGFLNADHEDDSPKGLMARSGNLISAGANIFLLLTAARLAWQGGGSSGGGNGEENASAWLMQQPFGPFLLGIAGAGIVAAGMVQIWYGASGKFQHRLSLPAHNDFLVQVSRFGLIARGLVIAVIGGFVVYAAFTVSPEQAGGIREALDYFHQLPFGNWLYAIMALGLIAFGIYGIIQARYRHIDAPNMPSAPRGLHVPVG